MKKDVARSDLGEIKSTASHNGQEILEVPNPQSPDQTVMAWLADSRTVVGGSMEALKAAIDQGSTEKRFERFDFVQLGTSQVTVAIAPANMSALQQAAGPMGAMLPPGLEAASLQIAVTDALKVDAKLVCSSSDSAAALHNQVSAAIENGKAELDGQIKANPLSGMMLLPVQKIVQRVEASLSGSDVLVKADATNQELTTLSNNPIIQGGLAQLRAGAGGGMSPGGGPPPGFGPPPKDDVPFGQETARTIDFEESIAPILKWRCGNCHIDKSDGGLSLASYEALMAHSSDSGKAVVPGKPDESSFFNIAKTAPSPHPKLKDSEVAMIRSWIESGAPAPGQKSTVQLPPAGKQPEPAEMNSISYAKDVAPIISRHCGSCHVNQRKGNLSLANLQSFTAHSSQRRGKALEPGNPQASSLYSLIANGQMPPPATGKKVPQNDLDVIANWIKGGAKP